MMSTAIETTMDSILFKAEEKRIPLWAHLDITYRCNLNCIHCYCQGLSESFTHGRSEMTVEEIKSVIDELAQVGSLYLTLSGGEIFTHPHFFEIARYARERNFCLTLLTNGTLLNESIVKQIKQLTPKSVEMSIYGTTAEVHDAITQTPGSFEKVVRAVKLLKENGIRVVMKSVIMKSNVHQAEALSQYSEELGADDFNFTMEISRKNDGSVLPQQYQISPDDMKTIASNFADPSQNTIHEFQDNPLEKPLCGAGLSTCYISPFGDVYPCIQLLIPMGNAREKPFREIWNAPSQLRDKLAVLNTYNDLPACRTCDYVSVCRKCIGIAHLETCDMRQCYGTLRCISQIEYELHCKGSSR